MKKIPIVGIGASAGGLKEFEQFFKNMPSTKEVAFVIIQHLAPNHKSMLADIVNRYTEMDVCQIEDKMKVQAGKVYIIPPKNLVLLDKDKLVLQKMTNTHGINLPIDVFFRSMKDNIGEMAVAVILSGTGSDGTLGIKEVKEGGGLTIVQQPDTADHNGMPSSAIRTGLIDYSIPVEEMPNVILNYIENEFQETRIITDDKKSESQISHIFELVNSKTGNDFTNYKRKTTYRRVERRITVNNFTNLKDYIKMLEEDSTEVSILHKELLISVTSFFRDKKIFDYIEQKLIPEIVSNTQNKRLRIWIPACATGEEAYSWAMLFKNYIDDNRLNIDLQVFASDIDVEAINKAREGFYTKNIVADVNPHLLERNFIKEEEGYRIKKPIREIVIFAEQNLVQDPPYSRLDMISCRNLLIYFDNFLQQKAISIFHYALKKSGILVLGNSENLSNSAQNYKMLDRKYKIFRKTGEDILPARVWKMDYGKQLFKVSNKKKLQEPISDVTKELMLQKHTPPGVAVDKDGEMIYIQGRPGRFFDVSTGEVNNNIIKTVKDGLKIPVSNALRKAQTNNAEVTLNNIEVKTNGNYEYVDIIVEPLEVNQKETKLFVIVFKSVKSKRKEIIEANETKTDRNVILELEKELAQKEQYLQNAIEELETGNEELKSANEEEQSMNEELQSTNEELETSKEELQSVNEELTTTNTELALKIDELDKVNSKLTNLLAADEIATIFLDKDLRIFSFTPAVANIVELLNTDIGRSIKQFTNNLKYDNLINDAKEVLKTLIHKEVEVQNNDNKYFWMRILPYRTIDDKIEGLVVTFTDITEKKKQEAELEMHRNHLEELVEEKNKELKESERRLKDAQKLAKIGHWNWQLNTNQITWSDETYQIFGQNPDSFDLTFENVEKAIHPDDIDMLRTEREKAIKEKSGVDTKHRIVLPDGSIRWVRELAKKQTNENDETAIVIMGTVQDITDFVLIEQKLEKQAVKLKELNNDKDKFFSIIAHDLRSPFNSIIGFTNLLAKEINTYDKEDIVEINGIINTAAKNTLELLDNLLNWAKSEAGKIAFEPQKLSFSIILKDILTLLGSIAQEKSINIIYKKTEEIIVYADMNMLSTILRNLISNAIKFTNIHGKIELNVSESNDFVEISIKDNGVGMDEDTRDKLFDLSTTIPTLGTADEKGTGLGLVLCKDFVEKHGGTIWVESEVGKGSEFKFTIPLNKTA